MEECRQYEYHLLSPTGTGEHSEASKADCVQPSTVASIAIQRKARSRICIIFCAAVLLISTTAATVLGWVAFKTDGCSPNTRISSPTKSNAALPFGYCGTSPLDAKERGCVFDVMIPAWLPEDCYDPELTEYFIQSENFTWYEDRNLTVQISMDDIRTGLHERYYSESFFHVRHCKYTWMKQYRAFADGRPMDTGSYDYDHTVHCADRMITGDQSDARVTEITVEYRSCVVGPQAGR